MNKIESQADFMSWAKDVNTQNGCITTVQALCDLQDAYARSEVQDIKSWFIDSDRNDKHLLIFSIQKAMGSEALIQIINAYACNRAQDVIDRELEQLAGRERDVGEREHQATSKAADQACTIEKQLVTISYLQQDNNRFKAAGIESYKVTSAMENQLEDMQLEIDRLRDFESHIKGLLNS